MKRKIYIIEDDRSINRGIELTLGKEKYEFRNFYNLSDVKDIHNADLIILDINLPDGNGLDFLKMIRKSSRKPVLILTANDSEIAEVEGFQLWADDYVTKPFSLMALRLRIENLLERSSDKISYSKDGLDLDFDSLNFKSNGAMAIPIAIAKGLKVITNGSADNKERVLELGLIRFIDYKTEDYTKVLSNVDYVLDTLGGNETERQMTILKKGGKLVSLRAMPNGAFAKRMKLPKWKQILFGIVGRKFDKLAAKYGVTYDFIFVESNGKQLQEVADIFENLKIKPSIDTVYKFEEVNRALDKVANGHSKGKTVIVMEGK